MVKKKLRFYLGSDKFERKKCDKKKMSIHKFWLLQLNLI